MSRDTRPATPKEMLVYGLLAGGVGLFFVLVGLGVVPPPGGKKSLHAPLWVVFCAGLTFLLAGASLLIHRAGGGTQSDRELPPDAPRWMPVAQYFCVLAILIAFAAVASWVAFAPGVRQISFSMSFFSGPANEYVGRAAFALGAVVLWACVIGVAATGMRKVLRREKS